MPVIFLSSSIMSGIMPDGGSLTSRGQHTHQIDFKTSVSLDHSTESGPMLIGSQTMSETTTSWRHHHWGLDCSSGRGDDLTHGSIWPQPGTACCKAEPQPANRLTSAFASSAVAVARSPAALVSTMSCCSRTSRCRACSR